MSSDPVEMSTVDHIRELEPGYRYRLTCRDGFSFDVVFETHATTFQTTAGRPTSWRGDMRSLGSVLDAVTDMKLRNSGRVDPELPTVAWSPATVSSRRAKWALGILAWCETLLPRRLRNEDLGDALEDLARFSREGRSDWHLLGKAITTALVLLVNAVREVAVASLGKRNAGP